MLKKEFQEVLKQSLVYIGLSVGIPLVLKVVLAPGECRRTTRYKPTTA